MVTAFPPIGINQATDSPDNTRALLMMLDDIRIKFDIPTKVCVLAPVTTTLDLIRKGASVDLVGFHSSDMDRVGRADVTKLEAAVGRGMRRQNNQLALANALRLPHKRGRREPINSAACSSF